MTLEEANAIAVGMKLGLTFESWRFETKVERDAGYGVRFTFTFLGMDIGGLGLIPIYTCIVIPEPQLSVFTKESLVRWLEGRICDIVRHEVAECLTFEGVQVRDPHEAERKGMNARASGQQPVLR